MNKVTVTKKDLLKALNSNLKNHIEDRIEMLRKRRVELMACFNEEISNVAHDTLYQPKASFKFPLPEDNRKDYERAIKMAEMSVDEKIELTEHQFDQLVMDNWSWSIGNNIMKTQYLNK